MMFWRMTGLSTASPVDAILDKENYTLEELLDEDEIIQECKALNNRLINFLRERAQVQQLLRYIIEEAPDDDEKKWAFKFPFIACEIFTCEVGIILQTLVEDEELMDLLFSFLKPDHSHSTLLAGYFSKVILCLMVRKTDQLMSYVQAHQDFFYQLIDLIGITSMMEVLIRLIGADENMHFNYTDRLQWLDDAQVIDLIVDKFCSSDAPEVHANTAEVLCAITRYAPPGLAARICSPSFVERLFRYALEDSRPKSVLVHSLTVCISLLDPKKLIPPCYQSYCSQPSHGSVVTVNQETLDIMIGSLGDLLKLLNPSTSEVVIPTTYGCLKPPLGKHRLKIVEFISILLTSDNGAADKELIRLGAIKQVLDLFLEYPYNNLLHRHVENIVGSCLDSKSTLLVEHLLNDCHLVGRILGAEMQPTLQADSNKPTQSEEGRVPPRIGNIGHLSRIANKLLQAANTNGIIQTHLQENIEWVDWHANVLIKRNAIENVNSWTCGRPTSLQDQTRDSDDDDFRDKDYDVDALASNLSQAFRYNIHGNDDITDAHGSLQRDDEVKMAEQSQNTKIQTSKDYEMKISNKFQPLHDFPPLTYSKATSKVASKPIPSLSTPQITTNFSAENSYFTKTDIEHIVLTNFKESPNYQGLQSFTSQLFPPNSYCLDDPLKTQKYYELIIVDSGSVDITHTPDHKNPTQITYSKCVIKKVLSSSEWSSQWTTKEFSIHFIPHGYNFHDYRMAWYRTFFYRPFNHSWFMAFHANQADYFPIWFYEWWLFFGSVPAILPAPILKAYDLWINMFNMAPTEQFKRSLLFYKAFKIPWIFCWSFKCQKYYGPNYPYSLIREFKVKWWQKFNQQLCTTDTVLNYIQYGNQAQKAIQQVSQSIKKNDSTFTAKIIKENVKAKAPQKTIIHDKSNSEGDSEDESFLQYLEFKKFKKLQKQMKAAKGQSSKASSHNFSPTLPSDEEPDPFSL